MRIWEGLGFFTLVFMLAGYVLLALLVFTRALSAFVSRRRAAERSVNGPAHVNRPDRGRMWLSKKRGIVSSKNRPDWS